MKKAILAIAAAATIAAGTLTAPTAADAGCRNCGGAVAAGVIGGVVAGAIIGGAIAGQPRYYAPAPGYVVYEGYRHPYPADCEDGYWARRRLYDRTGNFVGWSKPRFVCPQP